MTKTELIKTNGQAPLTINSREVAEMVDKEHKNLLRDIASYCKVLESSKLSSQEFFIPSTYKTKQNKNAKCYEITRKGCDMVANKMIGEKGILFTATYVSKFEEMEKQLAYNQFNLPRTYKEALLALVAAEEEKELLIAANEEKEVKLLEQAPKVEMYNDFISKDGLYSVGDIAKTLAVKDLGRNNLYKWLRWNKIFQDGFEAYQRYVNQGYIVHRTNSYVYVNKEGVSTPMTEIKAYFTPKGVNWLYKKLVKNGYKIDKSAREVLEELEKTKK